MSNTFLVPRTGILPPPAEWWCDAQSPRIAASFLDPILGLTPTPLVERADLAAVFGVGRVLLKDETARLGLGSFKALGGKYAVIRLAHQRAEEALGRTVAPAELLSEPLKELTGGLTFVCASDGNHGLSVTAGARLLGARCIVFLHEGVHEDRAALIRELGGVVVRTRGSYARSVAEAAAAAEAEGWLLVADTVEPGDAGAEACAYVMQGYCVMVDEILAQLASSGTRVSHVFVQAGVGGLAGSVFGHWYASRGGEDLPRFVIVEPDRAACLSFSARTGVRTEIPAGDATNMAMLECQKPSAGAWPTVIAMTEAFVTVTDEAAAEAVALIGSGAAALPTAPSGAAGVAGIAAVAADRDAVQQLEMGPDAVVLAIVTEGACRPGKEGAA